MLPVKPAAPVVCRNLIGGQWQDPAGQRFTNVISPWYGTVVGRVALSQSDDLDAAVAAATGAAGDWRRMPIKERSLPLFRYRELLLSHQEEIAILAALESGKTPAEARAGLLKGIEVIEYALSLQNITAGARMMVSRGVYCESRRDPLGVVAGITPFNFPAMVPLWMYPIALMMGNCFILKPSEKVPLTSDFCGRLMVEAGFPPGTFSVLHGDREMATGLLQHQGVRALAFVGSTPVARRIFTDPAAATKPVLALGGAKNHMILVPDADPEIAVSGILGSFTGCAGQRCMAGSVLVVVGDCTDTIARLESRAAAIRPGEDMGAIISAASLQRINGIIGDALSQGAGALVDGRQSLPADRNLHQGFWTGPTILDQVRPEMSCYSEEIFGPVLSVLRVPDLSAAIDLVNGNPWGNATSIFTGNPAVAERVAGEVKSGMIGINVGVPVPREPFSFGGTGESRFGAGDITGEAGMLFWSEQRKITSKWSTAADNNWMS